VKGPVICGVDDSRVAAGAIETARELAQRYQLPLVYAHVIDNNDRRKHTKQLLHDAIAPQHAETALEHGHPADRLLALAQERHASFLVLGNHGPRSPLLESISADVARRAPCPVVIVPTTATTATPQTASTPELEGGIIRLGPSHTAKKAA